MTIARGWGQDLWGFQSPWGAPSTGWYSLPVLQPDNVGQYLSLADAQFLQFNGHEIVDLLGNPLTFDESALVAAHDY